MAAQPNNLYLHLYHGRDTADQDMDDWGFEGPSLGPFSDVIVTYLSTVRCMTDGGQSDELWLVFQEDMVVHDGKFYGDFCINTQATQ